jgi:hypothetical protein
VPAWKEESAWRRNAVAWLVDPLARTLEVLRLENSRWSFVVALGADETVRAEPFEAVEIVLPRLWD